MLTSIINRKWTALLILPILATVTQVHAEDQERAELVAAIKAVNDKIDSAYKSLEEIAGQIPKVKEEITYNKKMYDETHKSDYLKAYDAASADLAKLIKTQHRIEVGIEELLETRAYLEEKLAQIGG
jgi:septal ring factor EnvC (AmiA/AmiB activator)